MRERFERFDKYMKEKGLNDNQVTKQCGLSQGLLGQARTGKSDLGMQTVNKILKEYQDLNRVWLLTGEGEMLNQNVQIGDGTNIAGDKNQVNESKTVELFLKEIAAQRRIVDEQLEKKDEQIEKKDEQINRLISLLERYTEK